MKWQINSKINYTEDPGFRKARYVFVVIIILVFIMIIWYGNGILRISEPKTLVVYCYSGMQVVMEQAIFPSFREHWFEQTGEKLEFIATFAGSGEITKKVLEKFQAEVAILSSKLDVRRLSIYGITGIKPYADLPHQGIFARTPLVMLTDTANPISSYADLDTVSGKIILPNPVTSGAGQLGVLAIYHSKLYENNIDSVDRSRPEQNEIWSKIDFNPSCALRALANFNHGQGDFLITYEANLLATPKQESAPGNIIYPISTIICEPVVISIDRNIDSKQKELVDTFIQFLWSPEVQKSLVDYGFQSVDENLNLDRPDFGYIKEPFTLDSHGSFLEQKKIIDSIVLEFFKQPLN